MKSKKNLYQAKGSEHYLIFIELSEQKHYTTDWIGTIRKNSKRNKEKKKKAARKKVLVLVERIQKKSAPRKFYKQSVQNIAYFNKEQTYVTKNKTKNR